MIPSILVAFFFLWHSFSFYKIFSRRTFQAFCFLTIFTQHLAILNRYFILNIQLQAEEGSAFLRKSFRHTHIHTHTSLVHTFLLDTYGQIWLYKHTRTNPYTTGQITNSADKFRLSAIIHLKAYR